MPLLHGRGGDGLYGVLTFPGAQHTIEKTFDYVRRCRERELRLFIALPGWQLLCRLDQRSVAAAQDPSGGKGRQIHPLPFAGGAVLCRMLCDQTGGHAPGGPVQTDDPSPETKTGGGRITREPRLEKPRLPLAFAEHIRNRAASDGGRSVSNTVQADRKKEINTE